MSLEWEDPPERTSSSETSINHREVAAQLRERPGVWARVRTYRTAASAASMAQQIRDGHWGSYKPSGSFDARARTVRGEHWLYARFKGELPTEQ